MNITALLVRPIDTLFFRDGRDLSGGSRPVSGLPLPQTLAGAIRTWILEEGGADLAALGRHLRGGVPMQQALAELGPAGALAAGLRLRGPWLADLSGGQPAPLLPAPADLQQEKNGGKIIRLAPLADPPIGWQATCPGLLPLWNRSAGSARRLDGYLTPAGIAAWTAGGVPAPADLVALAAVHGHQGRTGIAIDPETGGVREGAIYTALHLVLAPHVGLYVELWAETDLPALPAAIPLGGEGRRVHVERCPPATWPRRPAEAGRRTLLLTTPAPFAGGWRPMHLDPVAAAVPSPIAFSGWDLALGGPKPTRYAVPPGAVFYVDGPTRPGPLAESLCDDVEDARRGFGMFLEGAWPA